jgi:hypothetical protein
MSDELFEKDESEDEDVEGHKTRSQHTRMGSDEPEAEDVEAHKAVRLANDDDDSDDVEAHRRQA